MIKFILWIWQLPQNLVGWIYSKFGNKDMILDLNTGKCITIFYAPCFKAGATLGQYIILDPVWQNASRTYFMNTVKHEYGHSIQSKYLGWFYLLVVGLPSVFRNILNRINNKKFNHKWYYSGYPEKWADKLGGVIRS